MNKISSNKLLRTLVDLLLDRAQRTLYKGFVLVFFIIALMGYSVLYANTAPVVTNVTASQRDDGSMLVDIYYNVYDADGDVLTISLQVSNDNGLIWSFPCNQILPNSHIGEGIYSGTGKHIVWNVGAEHPEMSGNEFVFKVIANDGVAGLTYQWFDQPYYDGGTAASSTYDSSLGIDYELADNFWGVEEQIEVIEFYGLSMKNIGAGWFEVPPSTIENFIVKFYEYNEEPGGVYATNDGIYSVALRDSYGDGWNGGLLTVYVNGTAVHTNITLLSGAGPLYFDIPVLAGDNIWTTYTPGSWAYESYYAIIDNNNHNYPVSGTILAESGGTWANPGASTPTGIPQGGMVAVEPVWTSPVIGPLNVPAYVEHIGTVWGGAYQLYKYTVQFASPITITDGWISLQIDVSAGSSGAWFLWLNSVAGDLVAYQRVGTRSEFGELMLTRGDGADVDRSTRGKLSYDLAYTFWGPEP